MDCRPFKPGKRGVRVPSPSGGFSLIEVIVSVALIALISTGFLQMVAVNTRLLAREQEMDRQSYEFAGAAARGEGDVLGDGLTVRFDLGAEEYFEQYQVTGDGGDRMTYYRLEQEGR